MAYRDGIPIAVMEAVRLRSWIAVAALSVVAPAAIHYYGAWRRGDDYLYSPRRNRLSVSLLRVPLADS